MFLYYSIATITSINIVSIDFMYVVIYFEPTNETKAEQFFRTVNVYCLSR